LAQMLGPPRNRTLRICMAFRDARCGRRRHPAPEVRPFQDVPPGDPPASAWRVLSARACSPSCAAVDSPRKAQKATIRECARSTGGTRPTHATGPLPYCHPPRLRPLDVGIRLRQAAQPTRHTRIGTKSARSGLTITCQNCNGAKGRKLDWTMRNAIGGGEKRAEQYGHRSAVAVLCYAYLLAFAHFGYGYVLRPVADEIRKQIAKADGRHTSWLDEIVVNVGDHGMIVCSELGYPCVFGFHRTHLEVLFWRFMVLLPGLHQADTSIAIPNSVIALAEAANREASAMASPPDATRGTARC
jgi:hypothetical protein